MHARSNIERTGLLVGLPSPVPPRFSPTGPAEFHSPWSGDSNHLRVLQTRGLLLDAAKNG